MPTEILPDVYDITCRERDGRRYRVFLFDLDEPVLVDAGFESTVEAMFSGVEAVGVEPDHVVVTHGDSDHVGGLPDVAERYGATTCVPEGTDVESPPDERIRHGDRIGPFEAVHVPGHSADHHAFVDEDAHVAVLGDAVFGSDLRGLPAGHYVLPPGVYSEDLHAAERNLERLLDYEFDSALLFHGSSVLEDAHGKMDRFVNFPGKP